MPLGNYTSQFFANVYLNKLDYYVKHELKIKYYIRYVDDFVILYNNKETLEFYKEEINSFLKEELKIELHKDKSKIIPLNKGVTFLGFRNFYHYRLLKKSNIKQIKRNLELWNKLFEKGLMSQGKLNAKIEGWVAHASYSNSYKLIKTLKINSFLNV